MTQTNKQSNKYQGPTKTADTRIPKKSDSKSISKECRQKNRLQTERYPMNLLIKEVTADNP